MPSLHGKTVLVTGATSGIGKATARALARMGARVLIVGRDPAKCAAVQDELKADTGGTVERLAADLSSQASIRQLAEEVRSRTGGLHVLVNNAGGYFGSRRLTVDGLEYTFALNHLAYFLLTNLLLDMLVKSAPARVVSVSSGAQAMGRIDFNDLQGEKRYGPQRAYSQSKLANVLFTYELARRLAGTGVTANCLHPGVVRTGFGKADPSPFMRFMIDTASRFMLSPEDGAATSVHLASSPEVEGVSGTYFAKSKPVRSSRISYDAGTAERLWAISAELTGLAAPLLAH
jgi:retinol dehydrogenase 14